MADFEKLVADIMRECEADGEPVSREDAEEMARMEIGAKDVKLYAKSETPKERKPKEKKIDEGKAKIIAIIAKALTDNGYNVTVSNIDKSVEVGDCTVNLVKHRPPKA